MSREKRSDDRYEIEGLSKGLIILEALEGTAFQPVPVKTIMERTQFSRDTCDRTLKTLRMKGYAICEKGKWSIGKRLIRFAGSITKNQL